MSLELFFVGFLVSEFILDPYLETADADLSNNVYPQEIGENYFNLIRKSPPPSNPMQDALKAEEGEEDEEE